jgi:hypothetical protein
MSPFALIDKLGGYRVLAERVGRSPSRVHRWQDEGIPPSSWRDVLAEAHAQGLRISLDDIAALEVAPREKQRRGRRSAAAAHASEAA